MTSQRDVPAIQDIAAIFGTDAPILLLFPALENFSHRSRRPAGGRGDAPDIFRFIDIVGKSATDLVGAGKIPQVGEITALLRLHRLDGAIIAVQENAFMIVFLEQGQAAAVPGQARELPDEIVGSHVFERCDAGDFVRRQPHLPRPATTGGATLAFEEDGHAGEDNADGGFRQDHRAFRRAHRQGYRAAMTAPQSGATFVAGTPVAASLPVSATGGLISFDIH